MSCKSSGLIWKYLHLPTANNSRQNQFNSIYMYLIYIYIIHAERWNTKLFESECLRTEFDVVNLGSNKLRTGSLPSNLLHPSCWKYSDDCWRIVFCNNLLDKTIYIYIPFASFSILKHPLASFSILQHPLANPSNHSEIETFSTV